LQKNIRRKTEITAAAHACPSRDEVIGVANLLLVAKGAVETHCRDEVCIALIDTCIDRLRTRYGLSRLGLGDRLGECAELPAAVRVLQYAHAEAIENLSDSGCADLLAECIGRLTRNPFVHERRAPRSLTVH